jgi:trigger factor
MNINVDHQSNCRVKLHIEVPAEKVKKRRGEIISYFAKVAKIPGYRPGKIPAHVVTQRYQQEVDGELQHQLVNDGCREAITRENLQVIHVVSVTDRKFNPDHTFTFTAEVDTAPKFELPELKGIPVKLEKVIVTEADVEHELYQLREQHMRYEDKDGAAAIGDVVVLSYTVSMDGEPLEQLHPDLPKYFHSVEENWFALDKEDDFIPGFYAELTGMKVGDKKEFTLGLPGDFHHEALQHKNIEFSAECKGVKEKRVPELNDEFIKKFGDEMTMERIREEVEASLRQRREQARDAAHGNQVIAYLDEKLDFELPQEALDREAQRRTNDIAIRAARQGMSNDDIMNHQDEIVNSATQQARQSLRVSFILEEVAKKENIQVAPGQLQMALANYAARSGKAAKKFMAEAKRDGLVDRLVEDIRLQNALEFLKEHAAIEEVEPGSVGDSNATADESQA